MEGVVTISLELAAVGVAVAADHKDFRKVLVDLGVLRTVIPVETLAEAKVVVEKVDLEALAEPAVEMVDCRKDHFQNHQVVVEAGLTEVKRTDSVERNIETDFLVVSAFSHSHHNPSIRHHHYVGALLLLLMLPYDIAFEVHSLEFQKLQTAAFQTLQFEAVVGIPKPVC